MNNAYCQHEIQCHHTGTPNGVMVYGAIGYTSPLVQTDGTLNSGRYISVVLSSVALPLIRARRNATFQELNARSRFPLIVLTFLDTENVRLHP